MQRCYTIILLIVFVFGISRASAQNTNNPLLYSNQAVMFGDQVSPDDPVTIIMPGTAYAAGFGSFLDNPASAALFDDSFGEFGLSYKMVNEDADYLGQSGSADDMQGSVSNLGFVYRFPTTQGRFVIGGGYTQNAIHNRALAFNARNDNSTITDNFKTPASSYADIAYSTYATDYGDEFEDWDESILRLGFDEYGEYLGMRQQGEIFQRGFSGEYSLFFGTEFQENLMIGASVGILNGRYRYDRIFQEIDEFNDYNSDFIDSNNDGLGNTDVDNILLDDDLTSRYTGFRARVGAIYRVTPFLNIGASHTLPTRISIEETFNAAIENTFDNGDVFEDLTESVFTYYVTNPSRTVLGLSLNDLAGVSVSLSADYVDYSNTSIDFDDSSLFEDEQIENDFIEETFRPVWSFRSGLAWEVGPDFTLRAGYGFLPSRFEGGTDDKSIYSLGMGFGLSNDIRFEVATQYTRWDEVSTVYEYGVYDYSPLDENPPTVSFQSEDAARTVDRFQVLATIRVNLY
ncbi:MAG: hypothetical protein WEA56_15135 [Balneolaceae bacterium]